MAEEIIEAYGEDLETLLLRRGPSGRFEVEADGKNVYSKMETKRHAQPGEVVENIRNMKGVSNT